MKADCPGGVENGPGKRYAVCRLCGALDYEANEGDRCRALVESEALNKRLGQPSKR